MVPQNDFAIQHNSKEEIIYFPDEKLKLFDYSDKYYR